MSAVDLLPPDAQQLVEAVARRVVELLDEREANGQRASHFDGLVDAAALAQILGVSRGYVYEHALELGGRRIGGGARPRLRFDVERARERWTARDTSKQSQQPEPRAPAGVARRRRRRAAGSGDGLLPVRGQAAA